MTFTICGLVLTAASLLLLLAGIVQKARMELINMAEDDIAISFQRYLDENSAKIADYESSALASLVSGLRTHLPAQERAYLFWWGVYTGIGTAIYWLAYLVVHLISN
jgi:hypothetical protein